MAKKKEVKAPAETASVPTPPVKAANALPETKAELLALYDTLKALGIVQISQLEAMISRAV